MPDNLTNVSESQIFAASITKTQKKGTIADIIQTIYCTIISSFLILHEFISPAWTQLYFGFLCLNRGKGIIMLFLGCLIMCEIAFNIIVSIITFTIGFIYIIISLIASLPPPNSFLVHWQNHKDFWAEGLDLEVAARQQPVIFIDPAIEQPSMSFSYPNSNLLHPSAWHPTASRMRTRLKSNKILDINLSEEKFYFPGETIRGHVSVKPKSSIKINPIIIKFMGSIHITAKDKEVVPLFETCKTLTINDSRKSTTLEAKPYSFPFEFTVPDNLPSAMDFGKLKMARIGYKLIAILNRPMMPESLCPKIEYPMIVLEHIDVTRESFVNSVEKQKEIRTVRNGPCNIKLSIPRSGYTRGETIPVNVVITTFQKFVKKNSLVIDLIRKVKIQTTKNSLDEEHILKSNKFDLNIIGPYNFSQSITSELLIRTTPPTTQFKCLNIQYKIRASLFTDNNTNNKKKLPLYALELPITIGTWPRADIPIDDDDDDDIIQNMGELMLSDETDDDEEEEEEKRSSSGIRHSHSNDSMTSSNMLDRRSVLIQNKSSMNNKDNYLNRSNSTPDLVAQLQQGKTTVIDPTIRLSSYDSDSSRYHRTTQSLYVNNCLPRTQHRRIESDDYSHTKFMRYSNVPNHTLTFLSSTTTNTPKKITIQNQELTSSESDFDDDDDLFAIIEKKKKREEKEWKRRQQRMM
ncbi:COPI associated protein-domain-containing protein [Cokeromyces recurvatus]|uniref:COPI associated protein-domain-containing protein n=1 Tax=Cokeromyces recurvatus TaxID=90255 RepID=UPI00221FBF7A|nr:COPI associated protein-domain-containing protein [Cokeromyces recurvatus]KAI7898787.1 COPI associated protein-domain-containing protein [Cokeromyces recurvatus]